MARDGGLGVAHSGVFCRGINCPRVAIGPSQALSDASKQVLTKRRPLGGDGSTAFEIANEAPAMRGAGPGNWAGC
jgi:hypothetical protein